MSVEENLRLVDVLFEVHNVHDWGREAEMLAEDVAYYFYGAPEPVVIRGPEDHRRGHERHVKVFPDFRLDKVRAFGQGEWVCVEYVDSGTFTRPMRTAEGKTISPTNRSYRLSGCVVYRIHEGKVADAHVYGDSSTLRAQLGLAP